MGIAKSIWAGDNIDLSAQDNLTGLAAEPQKTAYTWKTATTTLTAGTDYTEQDGVFTFLKDIEEPVFCEMTTAAFPKLTGANAFKTTEVNITAEPGLYLTINVPADQGERNLTFASSVANDRILIDWGDGKRVKVEGIAQEDDWGTTTTVTGTPTGDGMVKVYAQNITVFGCDSRVDGAQVTAIDVTKATALKELNIYTNAITTLDLSQNTELVKLNCYNNKLEALDLKANTKLTRLDAKNNLFTVIDLSANTELDYLALNDNPVEAINLTGNTKLRSLYLLNCKLSDIDLSKNTALTYVNVNNNKLTALDVTASEALGTLFCMGNQLTELKAENVTKSVNCSKNNFTLATLPVLTCKTFNYAPQNAMQIAETVKTGEKLDLSEQNNITGLSDVPQATTYTWKTEDGTTLVAGTDYIEENGVFTFLNKENMTVYCEMTTDAFPKFTGTNVFKTTTTLVEGGNSVESTRNNAPAITVTRGSIQITGLANDCNVKVYNLAGQAIAAQASAGNAVSFTIEPGLYIVTINNISYKVNAQ